MRKRTVLCFTAALLLGLLPLLASAETVLDLSQYSIVHLGDRKLVYQGPGKDYFRDGSAGVGATNDVRVYGTLGDWMMIGYVYSTDNFRVGWVEKPTSGMEIISKEDVGELSFEYVVRAVNDDCAMTYDPVFVSVRSLDLEKGDKVTLLCRVTKKWVYVEASIKGKPSRGFLYADMLEDVPVAADAAPLSPSGAGAKTVMRDMAAKTLEGNYAVFSGPGEGYARAQGDPYAGFETKVTVHGTEGGWALISFSQDGIKHYGYLPQSLLPSMKNVKEMTIDRAACTALTDTPLRDAPAQAAAFTARVPSGTDLVFLCWSDKQKDWALVEYVSGGEKARGFVPANCLDWQ